MSCKVGLVVRLQGIRQALRKYILFFFLMNHKGWTCIWKFKTRIAFLSLETGLSGKILFQMWWVSQTTCSAGHFWSQSWADMKSLNKDFMKGGSFFYHISFYLAHFLLMNWVLESSWYQNSHGLEAVCKVPLMPLTSRKYEVPFSDLYGLRQAKLLRCYCPQNWVPQIA